MAKFGIALGSGPRGLGFESRYSDQIRKLTQRVGFLICSTKSYKKTPNKHPVTTFVVTGFFFVSEFERPLNKHAGGMFSERGSNFAG